MPRAPGRSTTATFGDHVNAFYRTLRAPDVSGLGVEVMNPYREPEARRCTQAFYTKFFGDSGRRVFVIGINPGRFGGGATGIPFTDPVTLEQQAGIPNEFPKRRELSAEFVERVVNHFGGPRSFYRSFFITAVSPLGFTKGGLNYNYYDDRALRERLEPFIVRSMRRQLDFGARGEVAVVLGTGTNYRSFAELNERYGFFERVVAVEHPRFIMQYRRKRLDEFVEKYADVLGAASRS